MTVAAIRVVSAEAVTRITDAGGTLRAPAIGVVSPRNQPAAANTRQARSSALGAEPANSGSAASRFDQTLPPPSKLQLVEPSRTDRVVDDRERTALAVAKADHERRVQLGEALRLGVERSR